MADNETKDHPVKFFLKCNLPCPFIVDSPLLLEAQIKPQLPKVLFVYQRNVAKLPISIAPLPASEHLEAQYPNLCRSGNFECNRFPGAWATGRATWTGIEMNSGRKSAGQ